MKTINDYIFEKLHIGIGTKFDTDSEYIKIDDLPIHSPLYLLEKRINGKEILIEGWKGKSNTNTTIVWESTNTNSAHESVTIAKNFSYDENTIVAGKTGPYWHIFIAADKEYFEWLKDDALWNDLTDEIVSYGPNADIKMKKYIEEHFKVS